MFTGIIEEVGAVVETHGGPDGLRARLRAPLVAAGLPVGGSVAVNGTCLTATVVDGESFVVEMVPETLVRTNLGELGEGSEVNLERAMPAGGRFDGHIVQGHVDGVGVVVSVGTEGNGKRIAVEVPTEIERYLVEKGSVTVDGVSLTVAGVGDGSVEVALIPHTLTVTTLGSRAVGDRVNLEVDILAKYVERLVEVRS